MTGLVLKRAKFSRPSGQWQDEDYDVLADGKVVGCIYERGGIGEPPELRWFWSVTAVVPAIPHVTNGHASTRKEAMACCKIHVVGAVPMPDAAPARTW